MTDLITKIVGKILPGIGTTGIAIWATTRGVDMGVTNTIIICFFGIWGITVFPEPLLEVVKELQDRRHLSKLCETRSDARVEL
jgi:hypothetical protein